MKPSEKLWDQNNVIYENVSVRMEPVTKLPSRNISLYFSFNFIYNSTVLVSEI